MCLDDYVSMVLAIRGPQVDWAMVSNRTSWQDKAMAEQNLPSLVTVMKVYYWLKGWNGAKTLLQAGWSAKPMNCVILSGQAFRI